MSECIILCRIQDVVDFCGCIPPNYNNRNNASYCLLDDIPCLNRWEEKWKALEPLNLEDNNQAEKFAKCSMCLPRCNYINYKLTASWTLMKEMDVGGVFKYGIM